MDLMVVESLHLCIFVHFSLLSQSEESTISQWAAEEKGATEQQIHKCQLKAVTEWNEEWKEKKEKEKKDSTNEKKRKESQRERDVTSIYAYIICIYV